MGTPSLTQPALSLQGSLFPRAIIPPHAGLTVGLQERGRARPSYVLGKGRHIVFFVRNQGLLSVLMN